VSNFFNSPCQTLAASYCRFCSFFHRCFTLSYVAIESRRVPWDELPELLDLCPMPTVGTIFNSTLALYNGHATLLQFIQDTCFVQRPLHNDYGYNDLAFSALLLMPFDTTPYYTTTLSTF